MCGRFTLTVGREQLAAALGVPPLQILFDAYRPRYNIAPLQRHWILRLEREDRRIEPARWGLVNTWARDDARAARQINARAETADTRPAYRAAFQARRCAIPADGFFEWTGRKGAKQPIWFHRPEGGLLLFAGLYEDWRDPGAAADAPPLRTFTILTTDANATVAPVHDRMPVILDDSAADDWLFAGTRTDSARAARDPETLRRLLRPADAGALVGTPVSPRVNSVRHDDPGCLEAQDGRDAQGGLL